MPRKAEVTKEEMIEGAFRLVRERGWQALTARSLAAELGCSTQPVMYRFPSLAELREETYRRADRFHSEYLLASDGLMDLGLRYIRFAAEETNLFRFLFQSGHFQNVSVEDMIRMPEAEGVLAAAAEGMEMPVEEIVPVFEILFAAVHGYADLIANNAVKYDEKEICEKLAILAEALTGSK
ncbi:MAG: TetR/AcrR family transcriptional regulator [Solobacterium sp.]|nr:TetR/AcrR family transcriptional regulator [Solobacterium sp.]